MDNDAAPTERTAHAGRTLHIEKEVWSGTDLDNKLLPSISIGRLNLTSKIVTVNDCHIDGLRIKKLTSRIASHLQFLNCKISGSLAIHGLRGISGLSLRNCTIDGDLVLHDLDGLAEKATIHIEHSTIGGNVKLSSIYCNDIRLEGGRIRSLQMDQSEASKELSLTDGLVVDKGMTINAARHAHLKIDNAELAGDCVVAAAKGCDIFLRKVEGGNINIVARNNEKKSCDIKVDICRLEEFSIIDIRCISNINIKECSFERGLSLSRLSWDMDGVFTATDIGHCGRLSLLECEHHTPATDGDAETAWPATLNLSEISPDATHLGDGYVRYLEERLQGENTEAIGNILETHYSRKARHGDVDRIRYRVKINKDKLRIKNGSKFNIIKLALFGYVYGYGFRIANQIYTFIISSLAFSAFTSLTRNNVSSWFFSQENASLLPAFSQTLLLIIVGSEGPWVDHTTVSWQGALAITSFRTVVFLSLSGAIVRKIGRG